MKCEVNPQTFTVGDVIHGQYTCKHPERHGDWLVIALRGGFVICLGMAPGGTHPTDMYPLEKLQKSPILHRRKDTT